MVGVDVLMPTVDSPLSSPIMNLGSLSAACRTPYIMIDGIEAAVGVEPTHIRFAGGALYRSGIRPGVPPAGIEPASSAFGGPRASAAPRGLALTACRRQESNLQGYCFTDSASRPMSACVG